jgi:hypothetical protein
MHGTVTTYRYDLPIAGAVTMRTATAAEIAVARAVGDAYAAYSGVPPSVALND